MLDLTKPLEWLGSAGLGSLVMWFVSRKDSLRKAKKDEVLEMLKLTQDRLSKVEQRADTMQADNDKFRAETNRKIEELSTEKFALEAKVFTLTQQIAQLEAEKAVLIHRDIEFQAELRDRDAKIAAKSGELEAALARIEAIKEAQKRGELGHPVLFQNKKAGEEEML